MQIKCSYCDRDMTPGNNRCTYCQNDVSPDLLAYKLIAAGGIIGMVVSWSIGVMHGGIGNPIPGGLAGVFLVAIIAAACNRKHKARIYAWRLARIEERIREREQKAEPAPVPATLDFATLARIEEAKLLATGDYQKCPRCAEVIKREANLCRFCQQSLVWVAALNR